MRRMCASGSLKMTLASMALPFVLTPARVSLDLPPSQDITLISCSKVQYQLCGASFRFFLNRLGAPNRCELVQNGGIGTGGH